VTSQARETHGLYEATRVASVPAVGIEPIEAWAFGSLAGYAFADVNWSPRAGIQLDAASGDGNTKQTFGTFNPLFPNGYYFMLAGYTGYVNIIHVKPSLTLQPSSSLKSRWRRRLNGAKARPTPSTPSPT
jgi:hypothetical protein